LTKVKASSLAAVNSRMSSLGLLSLPMTLSRPVIIAGRAVLSASALVILASLPDVLRGAGPDTRATFTVGVLALGVGWLAFWWYGIDARTSAVRVALVAYLTAILALLTYFAPAGRDGLLLAALAAGAAFQPSRAAVVVVGISALSAAVQMLHGSDVLLSAGAAVNDLVVGVIAIGGRVLYSTTRSLTQARDEIARLAVSEERLRLARDLHDLLGQNLTLAVLKSELVARDLPADTPDGLRQTQLEVASALRQSLDDVRSAVAGYRRTDLRTELDGARAAFAAAGIELIVEDQLGVIPAVQDAVLAWALRECTTNVIRHSHATRCVVRLARQHVSAMLEVDDNGRGDGASANGSGLAGVAERVAAVGGSTRAAPGPGGGFRLTILVPVPAA
jgi:two-component system sensor histidine kinase DesK